MRNTSIHAVQKQRKWPLAVAILPGLLFFSAVGAVWIWMFSTMLGIGQPNYPTILVSELQGQDPALILTRDGSFVVAFRTSQGIYFTTSDNGTTWSPAMMVVNSSVYSHALVLSKDGSFMLAYSRNRLISDSDGPTYEGRVTMITSEDGLTWSPPADALVTPYGNDQISLLQLSNGSYILASEATRSGNHGLPCSIEIWFSHDAESWSLASTIPIPSAQGLGMAEAADGSIVLAIGLTGYITMGDMPTQPSVRIYRSIDGYSWNLYTTINATWTYGKPSLIGTTEGYCILAYSDDPPRPIGPYYGPILILTSFSDSQTIKTQITPVSKRSTSPSIVRTSNSMLAVAFVDMSTDKVMFIPSVPYPEASK